jgi:hypothetical protein
MKRIFLLFVLFLGVLLFFLHTNFLTKKSNLDSFLNNKKFEKKSNTRGSQSSLKQNAAASGVQTGENTKSFFSDSYQLNNFGRAKTGGNSSPKNFAAPLNLDKYNFKGEKIPLYKEKSLKTYEVEQCPTGFAAPFQPLVYNPPISVFFPPPVVVVTTTTPAPTPPTPPTPVPIPEPSSMLLSFTGLIGVWLLKNRQPVARFT